MVVSIWFHMEDRYSSLRMRLQHFCFRYDNILLLGQAGSLHLPPGGRDERPGMALENSSILPLRADISSPPPGPNNRERADAGRDRSRLPTWAPNFFGPVQWGGDTSEPDGPRTDNNKHRTNEEAHGQRSSGSMISAAWPPSTCPPPWWWIPGRTSRGPCPSGAGTDLCYQKKATHYSTSLN